MWKFIVLWVLFVALIFSLGYFCCKYLLRASAQLADCVKAGGTYSECLNEEMK